MTIWICCEALAIILEPLAIAVQETVISMPIWIA